VEYGCVGCVTIAVNADSAPAIAHDSDDIRPAKMPAIRAASGLAAAARIARPKRLRLRNNAIANTMMGESSSIPVYDGVTRKTSIVNVGRPVGSGKTEPEEALLLMTAAKATSTEPMPRVTTMLIRRGALRN